METKKYWFTLILGTLLLFNSCSGQGILKDNLVERDGIMYQVNSSNPYSGAVYDLHANQQKRFSGEYKNGRKHGTWFYYFENGQQRAEINFENGIRNGLEEIYYENGQLKSRVTYNMNQYNGLLEKYRENGTPILKTEYQQNMLNGIKQEFFEDGSIKEQSSFVDGKQIGLYVNYWKPNVKRIEYTIGEDQKNVGDYIEYNKDGSIHKHLVYGKNGIPKNTGTWKKHWDSNFQIGYEPSFYYSTVTFNDAGKPSTNVEFFYSRTGKLYSRTGYSSVEPDVLEGEYTVYYQNGNIKEKGTYQNNKRHGTFESYYEKKNYGGKSRLHERVTYKDGKLHGPYEKWNANGGLNVPTLVSYKVANMGKWWKLEGQCREGKFDGDFKVWWRYQHMLENQAYNIPAYMIHRWSMGNLKFNGRDTRRGIDVHFDAQGRKLTGNMKYDLVRQVKSN